MTYDNLVIAIKAWTENEETTFVSQIDTFIEFAELRILREADLNVARKYATATLTANDTYLSLPSDIIIIRSMHIVDGSGNRTYLDQKDPSFMTEYIGNRTTTGTPRYYSHWDHDTAMIVPASASSITVELGYTYRPTGLSASNQNSWIGTHLPEAVLFGALVEANQFMKGSAELTASYNQRYQTALQGVLMEQDNRNRTDEYRTRSIKVGA